MPLPLSRGIFNLTAIEETFIEMLDQLYWEGYAEQLREENPQDYQKQLIEFICN